MQVMRTALLVGSLALGVMTAGAWVASYFWWPQVGFPWPTTGLDQTHDRGFLLLINGRLFLVRQRMQLLPADASPAGSQTLIVLGNATDAGGQAPVLIQNIDTSTPVDGTTSYAADSRTLGTLVLKSRSFSKQSRRSSEARFVMDPMEPTLARTTWKWLGFSYGQLATRRIRIADASALAPWNRTSIPLWPFLLLATPAGLMLYRNRRTARWAREGRCIGCGYDLRESPVRCPECGRPAPSTTSANVATGPQPG